MRCKHMVCHQCADDCGQNGPVCATPPGCSRHWADRCRELVDERDDARAKYQWMVDRACDERLDGYRELGERAAAAENERDEAVEALESLEAAILESLPYRYDDGTGDEADPGECLEYAAEERLRLTMQRDEARAILRKREPTQEEAEDGETAPGRTHVKAGDWTGRICFGCAVWVWRGRIMCETCCEACEAKEQQA